MTPLVLIPGMMCYAQLFGPQIAAFSGRRTLICAPISGHTSIEDLATDVLANAPDRFALAGLSMGGIVAMEIMRKAPARIERIALMDTNPLAEDDQIKARRMVQMAKVRDQNLAAVMRNEMKLHYLSKSPQRRNILNLCMEMALNLGPHVFLEQSRALMDRPDQSDALPRFDVPALVLCGRDDRLCPISRHELMAALIPNARLEIIEGAGHLPTLEQPKLTNAALVRWLEA